mgnify:CR=1 FL=1
MKNDVTQRLASFGYTVVQADDWMLDFIIQKATNHILNNCNITSIPEELHEITVDMAVGEFLMGKKSSGQLDESDIMSSEAVSSIKLGDTQVNFGEDRTASQQVDSLIAFLMKGYESDLTSYRVMKW